jgi:hexulose-6-phosphate isomerase
MNQNIKKKKSILSKIGVMQGRLSPMINGKIQCFPWRNWKHEFIICNKLNIKKLEWTVDHEKFENNPICTNAGRQQIILLKSKYKIQINSVTADFFMQKPFYDKKNNKEKNFARLKNFIIDASKIQIKYIILPLVDNASIRSKSEERILIKLLNNLKPLLKSCNITLLFESDYAPKKLLKFIKKFDKDFFGINYDLGNSAGMAYNFNDEKIYFNYVRNIHIKDKDSNGLSLDLGKGRAHIKELLKYLIKSNYKGNLILQTARNKRNIMIIKKNIYFLFKILKNL